MGKVADVELARIFRIEVHDRLAICNFSIVRRSEARNDWFGQSNQLQRRGW